MRKKTKDATPQKRGARTRKNNRKREAEAFRRGRRKGWADVVMAYRAFDRSGFEDWLSTLTGTDLE
jgi:hypothetical protein